MSEFWMYFNIGLKHVLDINAYDHVLFLIALMVPYAFKDWKNVFVLGVCCRRLVNSMRTVCARGV